MEYHKGYCLAMLARHNNENDLAFGRDQARAVFEGVVFPQEPRLGEILVHVTPMQFAAFQMWRGPVDLHEDMIVLVDCQRQPVPNIRIVYTGHGPACKAVCEYEETPDPSRASRAKIYDLVRRVADGEIRAGVVVSHPADVTMAMNCMRGGLFWFGAHVAEPKEIEGGYVYKVV